MKHRSVVTIVSIVGVVALLAFEALAKTIQGAFDWSEETRVRLEIGLVVGFIVVVINLLFHLIAAQSEETSRHINKLNDRISLETGALQDRIMLLSSEQLYRELRSAAESSKSRIYTTYMGDRDPKLGATASKIKYFQIMEELPKKRPNLTVRRIVRVTKENARWAEGLARVYSGQGNVSIALLLLADGTPIPLSVQMYDNSKTFLVRIANRPPGHPRDIAISSASVVDVLDGYYDSLWSASRVVVDSGRLDERALKAILDEARAV